VTVASPLVVALDRSDVEEAVEIGSRVAGLVAYLKVGLELFTAGGPGAVSAVREQAPVFLDLKLHDIPTTVARAARNVGRLGVDLLTVHAAGGPDMVRAAVDGAAQGASAAGVAPPRIMAVLVLSSLADLPVPGGLPQLARRSVAAGAGGVVVSGPDVQAVREAVPTPTVVLVPGVRPASAAADDHARLLTPREALDRGADLVVVGRPITESSDPAGAARSILDEAGALAR
jgi:orotidine-5'-phosphate decarboxylase